MNLTYTRMFNNHKLIWFLVRCCMQCYCVIENACLIQTQIQESIFIRLGLRQYQLLLKRGCRHWLWVYPFKILRSLKQMSVFQRHLILLVAWDGLSLWKQGHVLLLIGSGRLGQRHQSTLTGYKKGMVMLCIITWDSIITQKNICIP